MAGKEILRGLDLTVRSGEVHAVMGPNGSGKSTLAHVLMGKPGYEVLGGSVTLDGVDLLGLTLWERAQAGLFLALQYPTEVPGVSLNDLLASALRAAGRDPDGVEAAIRVEAERLALDPRLIDRPLNVDLSGGEKKKNETLQLGVLHPAIAVLDELDSGLDVDARGPRPGASRPPRRRATGPRDWACSPSPTTAGCSTSCAPTRCTCWPRAPSSARAAPSWRWSWRSVATPASSAPSSRVSPTRAAWSASAPPSTTLFGGPGPFGESGL